MIEYVLMKPDKAFEAVDTLVTGMDGGERADFFEHLRSTYPEELGTAAVNGALVAAEAEVSTVLDLTPEQQEKAAKVKAALAEKFGVTEIVFSTLKVTTEEGDERLIVAFDARSGIDLGGKRKDYDPKRSWNSIFDKKNDGKFIIEVDGQKFDSRLGMTRATYEAMVAEARVYVEALPLHDSRELSEQNGEPWTWTWLTGEEADRDVAPIADVGGDGQVYSFWNRRDDGYRDMRFRPAVVIE